MRSPRTIILSSTLALLLGGCTVNQGSTTTPTAKGARGAIDAVVAAFSSDAGSANASAICTSVLSSELAHRLNQVGGCTKIITKQLATTTSTTLTVVSSNAAGNTGTAVVTEPASGKARRYTLHLVKQVKGGWRISSLG